MSATYIITGQRYQRQFTAAQRTPAYAAASDASMIASSLCGLPWERRPNVSPCFPAHPGKEQTDALNVSNRSYFDAALFCAEHDEKLGVHRAYANATCYKFTLPDLGTNESARVLESLTVTVNCDPYNAYGARIAVSTNSTGVIPTACPECRNGYQSTDTDSAKQSHTAGTTVWSSTNTHVEGVAPRTAEGNMWYASYGTAVIAPSGGLTLGKYLYVFVLLENYNTARNGYLEGSAFADPKMSLVLSAAIPGLTPGEPTAVDFSFDASRMFDVAGTGSLASLLDDNRKFLTFEAPRCGVESPEREVYVGATGGTISPAVVWRATTPSSAQESYANVSWITASNMFTRSWLIDTATGTTWAGGLYATYSAATAGSDDTSVVPGVVFYAATQANRFVSATSPFTLTELVVSGDQGDIPPNALRLLKEGDASTRIFFGAEIAVTNPLTVRTLWTIIVSSDTEAYVVGFLSRGHGASDTGESVAAGWSFLCLENDLQLGTSGVLTVSAESYNSVAASSITVSGNIITLPSAVSLVGMHFYTWISSRSDSVTVVTASNGSSITCRGLLTGVTSPRFGYIMNRTANTSIVVAGAFTQVGSVSCSRVAVVDLSSPDQPEAEPLVQVPGYDSLLSEVTPSEGFKVFAVPYWPQADYNDSIVGYNAIISVPNGLGVAESRVYSAAVVENRLERLPTGLGGVLANVVYGVSGYVLAAYSLPRVVRYSTTPMDSLLQDTSPSTSSLGLRNCFGKLLMGEGFTTATNKSVQPHVNFHLGHASRTLPISSDFGLTYTDITFPLWRISTSIVLVPFSMPDADVPAYVRLSWSALTNVTQGARFNLWYADGLLVKDLTGIDYTRILPATEVEVDGWKLVGSVLATETSCTFPFSPESRVGTFLLSAWISQDSVDLSSTDPISVGVGNLDVDYMSGIINGESTGWFPRITLIG